MHKAWNAEKQFFAQSFDEIHILDSAVLIMPLVFFSTAVSQFSQTYADLTCCLESLIRASGARWTLS